MNMDRARLLEKYWGTCGLPSEWKTEGELASELGTYPREVFNILHRHQIPLRTPIQRAHLEVWRFLEDLGLSNNLNFLYRTKVNLRPVDFLVIGSNGRILCLMFSPIVMTPVVEELLVAQLWTFGFLSTQEAKDKIKEFWNVQS